MSTLHIVSSTIQPHQQQQLIDSLNDNSSVIFVTDGTYLLRNNQFIDALKQHTSIVINAIEEDCIARALPDNEQFNRIDYDSFVQLTLAHENSMTW